MRHRTRIMVGVVAALALLAGAASARPHGRKMVRHDGARQAIGAMLHGAELDDAQRAAVRERLEARRAASDDTHAALREANRELQALLLAPEAPTEAQVRAVSERVAGLRAELLAAEVDTALELRGLLTPEQLAAASTHQPRTRHGGKEGCRDRN